MRRIGSTWAGTLLLLVAQMPVCLHAAAAANDYVPREQFGALAQALTTLGHYHGPTESARVSGKVLGRSIVEFRRAHNAPAPQGVAPGAPTESLFRLVRAAVAEMEGRALVASELERLRQQSADGQAQSAATEVQRFETHCLNRPASASTLDCGCMAAVYAERRAADPDVHEDILRNALLGDPDPNCIDRDRLKSNVMRSCLPVAAVLIDGLDTQAQVETYCACAAAFAAERFVENPSAGGAGGAAAIGAARGACEG